MAARALAINDWGTMAAADLTKVLNAIEGLRRESGEAIATLKVEVAYMVNGLKDLTGKVDRMDDTKAGRSELREMESRFSESVRAVKTAASLEAANNNQQWTSRLDTISAQMQTLQGTVADLERIRWKVTGIAAAVGAIAATVLPWLGKLLFH